MTTQSTLYDYWLALYRRRILILVVTLTSAIVAYGVSRTFPPIFQAHATFYIPVVNSTPLYTVPGAASQVDRTPLMPIPEEKAAGVHLGILKGGAISAEILSRFPEKTLRYLKRNVDFVLDQHYMTDVYVRDRDPGVAAAIANAYPVVYRNFHMRAISKRNELAVKYLTEQIQETQSRLAENLAAQQRQRDLNPSLSVRMEDLQFEHRRLTDLLGGLQENLIESKLESENPAVELVVVESAEVPEKPTFPRPILNAIVAGLFGLAVGCYYALFLEYLSKLREFRIGREMDTNPTAEHSLGEGKP